MNRGGIAITNWPATTLASVEAVPWNTRYWIKNQEMVRIKAKHNVAWPLVGVGSRSR